MKKVILSLSGILVAAFVIIMVANAQNSTQEVKKASTTTEVSKDCSKGPSAACCAKMAELKSSEAKACDPAKCKEMGCDPAKCKEGKCDPATCKSKCKSANGEAKKCDPAACKGSTKK